MKFATLIVCLLLIPLFMFSASYNEEIEKSFNLDKGGTLKIRNINGFIELSEHNGDKVEIRAVKRARTRKALENVDINFKLDGDLLTVETRYLKKLRSHNARVDLYIKTPKELKRVNARSINGRIYAKGDYGDLKLVTVNGRINFRGNFSDGDFSTTNGSVSVILEDELKGDVDLRSLNGSITFELDSKSAFSLKGSTFNGRIRSDFPISISKRLIGSRVDGEVNGGGRYRVSFKTTNGSFKLLEK